MKRQSCFMVCCILSILVLAVGCSHGRGKEETNAAAGAEDSRQTLTIPEEQTLRIYFGEISYGLSPFSCSGERDRMWMQLQYSTLGQIADITEQQDGENTIYTIALQEGIKTADGEELGGDDVLFNLYLRYDMGYYGSEEAAQLPVEGIMEYRYDAGDDAGIKKRKKQIARILQSPSGALKQRIVRLIIEPVLEQELKWLEDIWQRDGSDLIKNRKKQSFQSALEAFVYFYSCNPKYKQGNKTREQVLSDIQKQYGWDYKELSEVTGEDYGSRAESLALEMLSDEKHITSIRGIQKTDENTICIAVERQEQTDRIALEKMLLVPLSEYGSRELFLPEEGCFGFLPGQASEVQAQDWKEKKGTGPYYLQAQEGEDYWFCRNVDYWRGKPATEYLSLSTSSVRETGILSCLEKMCEGELDICWVPALTEEEQAETAARLQEAPCQYLIDVRKGMLFQTETVNAPSLPEEEGAKAFWEEIDKVRKN